MKKIIPKIYTEKELLPGGSNFTVLVPPNDKCLYLQAIFEYSEELSKFCKEGNYHIELVKNKE